MVYDGKAAAVRLEEVESPDFQGRWQITLSFTLPGVDDPTIHPVLAQFGNVLGGPSLPRHMKVFIIDSSGVATAMKIREK